MPNPKDDKIVQCKVNGKNHEYKIPLGKIIEKKEGIWSSEFVVYNTNQIKLRYLVKVKRDWYLWTATKAKFNFVFKMTKKCIKNE